MKEEKIEQPNVNYEDFLNNNPNLSQLYMPNLEQMGDRIILPDKIEGELHFPKLKENKIGDRIIFPDKIEGNLYLPSLEESKKAHAALISVGLNAMDFFYGNLSLEDMKMGLEALKNAGVDVATFIKSYPHLEGIDLDVEPKNKTF